MRVKVDFESNKDVMALIIEDPTYIDKPLNEYQKENSCILKPIKDKIDAIPLLTDSTLKLASEISSYYKSDLISVIKMMLPPSFKSKNSSADDTKDIEVEYISLGWVDPQGTLNTSEERLYDLIKKNKMVKKSEIKAKKALSSLISSSVLKEERIKVNEIPDIVGEKVAEISLTISQKKVVDDIKNGDDKIFLLQGIKGYNRTTPYIELVKSMLRQGKGALILMPEITLQDKVSNLFYSYFKDSISILSSSLSDKKKNEEYVKIKTGQSKVVLGTRDAIFAPIKDLGLIIIDEEHSSSYKRDDMPCFNAIHIAELRSKIEGCKVILSSFTPRVVDRMKAERGIYKLLGLNDNVDKEKRRDIIIVDMNDSKNLNPNVSSFISIPLQKEIQKRLDKRQQGMLLLNRRGYSPIYVCRECQKSVNCPNCGIPLSYHKRDDTLRCHHCGYKIPASSYSCSCSSTSFAPLGYGTEKAYEEIKELFPDAKICRVDSDIKYGIRQDLLYDFSKGDFDILIGTNIISKGMDFKGVTLACAIDPDTSLSFPTYMADEETFDLLSQFISRAGKGNEDCTLFVQTRLIDNPIIDYALKQDYDSFYRYELNQRRLYQYPPYTCMTSITLSSLKRDDVDDGAQAIKDFIVDQVKGKRFNVYGPYLPYISVVNGRYLRRILLKYKSIDECSALLDKMMSIKALSEKVDIKIDVDPLNED